MRNAAATARRGAQSSEVRKEAIPAWIFQLGFIAMHVPLALAIPKHSRLAMLHAFLALGVGMIAAILSRKAHFVACAAAYITGAGVFWRMKAAKIPWEFDKYAISVIFVTALVMSVSLRRPALPLAYLALLVPSAFLTLSAAPWEEAKAMLSFNLSGPIALTLSVLFFSSIRLSPAQMRWVATSLLAPIVSIATVAAYSLQAALADPEFDFYGGSSNAAASGGFGPNQVSAILGLGIVAIGVYLLLGKVNRILAGTMLLLTLFLARQCLITLSRGGVYMACGAVAAASVYLIREKAYRGKLLVAGAVIGAVLALVVIPRLQAITGGVLVSRFENTSGTGRELLIKGDMDSWSENPVLGVGPGMGGANRLKYFDVPTAHTEYTRLVAEHGALGLVALILMGAMAFRAIQSERTSQGKAISAAFLAYGLLFMAVDAMRFAAPAFAFGVGSSVVVWASRARPASAPRRPSTVGVRSKA